MSGQDAGADGGLRARKTWRTGEPLHGMIYFVPEAVEAYARLGITGRAGYFASRAAPMGAVSADVVVSTFFNFNQELVHAAIPHACTSSGLKLKNVETTTSADTAPIGAARDAK